MSKPIFHTRAGALSASVFEQTLKSKDGNEFTAYSVQVQRSYRDGDEVKYTTSLNERDLPVAASLLNKVFWDIKSLKKVTAEEQQLKSEE